MKLYQATYTDENGIIKTSLSMPQKMLNALLDGIQDTIDNDSVVVSFVGEVSSDEWESIQDQYING